MLRIMTVIVLLLVATAQGGEESLAECHIRAGAYHERYSGDLGKAEACYKAALAEITASEEMKQRARLGLATCAARKGDGDAALALVVDALKGKPEDLAAMLTTHRFGLSRKAVERLIEHPTKGNRLDLMALDRTIITKISFVDASLPTVIKFLKKEYERLTPDRAFDVEYVEAPRRDWLEVARKAYEDLAFEGADPWGEEPFGGFGEDDPGFIGDAGYPFDSGTDSFYGPTITMDFDDIPLGQALRYICEQANLTYYVQGRRLIIVANGMTIDPLEFGIYALGQEIVQSIQETRVDENAEKYVTDAEKLRHFLEMVGVEFPMALNGQRATAFYDKRLNRLIVRNTRENLTKVEAFLHKYELPPPQARLRAKLWEVRIAESQLARVRPEAMGAFIETLPADMKQCVSDQILLGLNGSVGQVKGRSHGELFRRSVYQTQAFSASTKVSENAQIVEADVNWSYKAWPQSEVPNGESSRPKGPPLWSASVDKTLVIRNGCRIAIQVAPAKPKLKRGAMILVVEPLVVDAMGAVVDSMWGYNEDENLKVVPREPDGGWFEVEGAPVRIDHKKPW